MFTVSGSRLVSPARTRVRPPTKGETDWSSLLPSSSRRPRAPGTQASILDIQENGVQTIQAPSYLIIALHYPQ